MGRMKPEDVDKLAELSRLSIDADKRDAFGREIEAILGYVSLIKNITGEVAVRDKHAPYNVLREDENPHESGVFTDAILKNAPTTSDGYIAVKNIF
jgi:aspartyl/glutamyl-tRNA(Asn/Gln) amidotransferase C subunit